MCVSCLSQTGQLLTLLKASNSADLFLLEAEDYLMSLWSEWVLIQNGPHPTTEDPTEDYEALTREAVRLEQDLARAWIQK